MTESSQLIRILEGLLFAAEQPMSVNQLLALFEESEAPEKQQIKEALAELTEHYAGRGIELKELASGYQFQVCADLSKWVQRLHAEKPPRYSRAMMETLALIAYRQPITRGEIEEIRGVAVSSNIVKAFLERDWVKIIGHRDVPGRPALLATTKEFLDYFGLKKLDELPPLSELEDLDKAGEQLEQQLKEEQDDATAEIVIASQDLEEESEVMETEFEAQQEADELESDVDLDDTVNLFAEIDQALENATAKVDAFVNPDQAAEVEVEDEVAASTETTDETVESDNENRETTETAR